MGVNRLKKYKFMFFLIVFTAIVSAHFCYADENTIDESRLNVYYVYPDNKEFTNGYGIIQNNSGYSKSMLFGLIDKNYNVVVEPKYFLINYDAYDKNIIYAYTDIYAHYGDIYKITDEGLKKINSEMYHTNVDFMVRLETTYNGLQGVGGESITNAFTGDMLVVADKDYEHYGVIDKSGGFIIPFTDKYIFNIVNDSLIARYERTGLKEINDEIASNGRLLNNRGEILTESEYDYIRMSRGYIKVSKDGKENILGADDYKELLDWSYTSLKTSNNYIIAGNSMNKYGLMDLKGNVLIDCVYDQVEFFGDYRYNPTGIYVDRGDNFNLLDLNDYHELLDWSYFYSSGSDDYVIARNSDNKYGMMDLKGNIIAGFLYDDMYTANDDNYVISENSGNKYGLLDKTGNICTDFIYRNIQWSDAYGFYTANKNGYIQKIKLPGESDELMKEQEKYLNENSPLKFTAHSLNINITVNGVKFDNSKKLYPFISDGYIAYVPMTYHDSRALNLKTKWSPDTGMEITRSDEAWEYKEEISDKKIPYSLDAAIAYYDIYINGKKINNFNRSHPILIYNGITYIPMDGDLARGEFGWDYNYSEKDGLIINSR